MATKDRETAAAEYKARAEADFNPAETARERLERLKREVAEVNAIVKSETYANVEQEIVDAFVEIVGKAEESTGQTCRTLTLRWSKPGDDSPAVVEKLESGKPGIIVKHRFVKARQKDS